MALCDYAPSQHLKNARDGSRAIVIPLDFAGLSRSHIYSFEIVKPNNPGTLV
jgi:hypothetical protein